MSDPDASNPIFPLLRWAVDQNASDLHLKADCSPALRLDGRLSLKRELPTLPAEALASVAAALVPEHSRVAYERGEDVDFAFEAEGIARFRVSVSLNRGRPSLVFRRIQLELPPWEGLGIPEIGRRLMLHANGLILVSGATGSGKSTTLAAMVDYLNQTHGGHVISLEDPIEFVHTERECLITQREIGLDCPTFQDGLRRALRQDADVIVLGELRDPETIQLAITAAETGHLVIATLHTTGACQTVDRVIDAFPPDARDQIRAQLAGTLRAVLSQSLLRRVAGGRIAAFDVLTVTEAVRACIRDGKTHQLVNIVQTGASHGMQRMYAQIAELVRRGVVSEEEASARCQNDEALGKALLSGLSPLRTRSGEPRAPERRDPVEPRPDEPASDALIEKLRRG